MKAYIVFREELSPILYYRELTAAIHLAKENKQTELKHFLYSTCLKYFEHNSHF